MDRLSMLIPTFHQDDVTFLWKVLMGTFTATFSSANSSRQALANHQPQTFKYVIPDINSWIQVTVLKIQSTGMVSDEEFFYHMFNIYKRIKSPAEWYTYILSVENNMNMGTRPNFTLMILILKLKLISQSWPTMALENLQIHLPKNKPSQCLLNAGKTKRDLLPPIGKTLAEEETSHLFTTPPKKQETQKH